MFNIEEFAEKIEKTIGEKFENKNLLVEAFVHRSFINENKDFPISSNERLEFLGDAILEFVVTEFLFSKFPDKKEGELTSLRAALVNTESLYNTAEKLGFGKLILLSKGERERQSEKAKKSIMADTFEAFLGALYLEKGPDKVKDFTKRNLLVKIDDIIEKKLYKDPKSLLQELVQERFSITPSYKILEEWGPDHDKHFVAGVYINDRLISKGEGTSKQEAELEAARKALENYNNLLSNNKL
ncbi:Ribonuclease 3 [bacterium HR34]|nr:Ribonuclease 3 [bacterium HR34]